MIPLPFVYSRLPVLSFNFYTKMEIAILAPAEQRIYPVSPRDQIRVFLQPAVLHFFISKIKQPGSRKGPKSWSTCFACRNWGSFLCTT